MRGFVVIFVPQEGGALESKRESIAFGHLTPLMQSDARWRAKAGRPLGRKAGWHLAVGLRGNFIWHNYLTMERVSGVQIE